MSTQCSRERPCGDAPCCFFYSTSVTAYNWYLYLPYRSSLGYVPLRCLIAQRHYRYTKLQKAAQEVGVIWLSFGNSNV